MEETIIACHIGQVNDIAEVIGGISAANRVCVKHRYCKRAVLPKLLSSKARQIAHQPANIALKAHKF